MPELRGTIVEMPDLWSSDKPRVIRCLNGTTFNFTINQVGPGLRDALKAGSDVDFSVKSLKDTAADGVSHIHSIRECTAPGS
jgi:hypothetical protein